MWGELVGIGVDPLLGVGDLHARQQLSTSSLDRAVAEPSFHGQSGSSQNVPVMPVMPRHWA